MKIEKYEIKIKIWQVGYLIKEKYEKFRDMKRKKIWKVRYLKKEKYEKVEIWKEKIKR